MKGAPKNIKELIAALWILEKQQLSLTEQSDLLAQCELVFQKLKISRDFDPNDLENIIDILEKLTATIKETEIEKLEIVEIPEEEIREAPESKLDKLTIDELVAEYEKAKSEAEKKEIASKIIKKTGKHNVEDFIRRYTEIARENRLIEDKAKELIEKNKVKVEEITRKEKIAVELVKNEIGIKSLVEDPEKAERVADLATELSLEERVEEKEIETKEIREKVTELVGKNSPVVEKIVQRIEEGRARVIAEKRAEVIAEITIKRIEEANIEIVGFDPEKTKTEIIEDLIEGWENDERAQVTIEAKGLTPENKNSLETIIEETVVRAEKYGHENVAVVENLRVGALTRSIETEMRALGAPQEAITECVEIVSELSRVDNPIPIGQSRDEVVAFGREKGISEGNINESFEELQVTARALKLAPKKFNQLATRFNALRDKLGWEKLPEIKQIRAIDAVMRVFKNNPQALQAFNAAQKFVQFTDKFNGLTGKILVKVGADKMGYAVLGRVGGQAMAEFAKNAMVVLAEQGTFQGIKSIALGILGGGVHAAPAAGAAVGSGALATAVAAFQAIPIVGQVVLAVAAAVMILKPIFDGIKDGIGKVFHIDLNGAKKFIAEDLGLGGIAGSVGQFAFDVGTFLIGIPALLTMVSFTAIIAPVVMFFFIGVLVYSLFQQNLMSSLVPPPQVNMGSCVLKTETETGSGIINCNKDAPENYFPGINKANFVRVANLWSKGENHAEECYNDTVNRALCAGINPAYALWAWVHESGASNYSLPEIEDFGIHGRAEVPAKNFSKQIDKFLTLRPGGACPSLGYWLSFATNYLTGGCDPDYVNQVSKMSGRDYLKDMQATWAMISSEPMPPDIKTIPSGKNCGNTNDETTDNPNTFEYTDEEGKTWICEDGKETVPGDYTGSMVPAEPIYDDSCLESPAYCVVKYLLSNGVQDITRANEKAVENLINQWKNAPASFNKSVFNSAMAVSTQYYDGFQCVGFAVGLTPILGTRGWGSSHENWQAMIARGSPECPRIEASGAGVGDFILFPTGSWYHIVVLSKLRPDGSFAISQANWGAPGRMSNVEGSSIQSYLKGKSVLRCK